MITLTRNSTGSLTRTSGYLQSEDVNVKGKLKWNVSGTKSSFVFPFVYSSKYIPFTFQLTSGNAGYMSVATYHTAPDNTPYPRRLTHTYDTTKTNTDNSANTVDRFWQINKSVGTASAANITFTYHDSEVPASGEDSLRAQRWNSSYSIWQAWYTGVSSQSSNHNANTVTANRVTTFSPWTLARRAHPLPISLLDFEAVRNNESVNLNWQTASEINNAQFTIERSRDAIIFEELASLKGAGNSNTVQNYQRVDYAALCRYFVLSPETNRL